MTKKPQPGSSEKKYFNDPSEVQKNTVIRVELLKRVLLSPDAIFSKFVSESSYAFMSETTFLTDTSFLFYFFEERQSI